MKFIIASTLAALASAEIMSRSQRFQLKQLMQIDLNSDRYIDVDQSILLALRIYVNSEEFQIPADVPKEYKEWFNVQTGRVECTENCDTGIMDMSPLFGYGCWCFFGGIANGNGRGPPIDKYDEVCKDLVQCYRCVVSDSDDDNEDCDPYNTHFDSQLQSAGVFGVANITTSCKTDNSNNCSWRSCSCAMTMVVRFFNLAFDMDARYDNSLKHENGFDYDLECPVTRKGVNRQCCGLYPNRRTYDQSEARQCCHQRTIYNPLRHICCDDGSHTGLGHRC